jgi:hypothetical protein
MIPQEDTFTDATSDVLVAAMALAKENGHAEGQCSLRRRCD